MKRIYFIMWIMVCSCLTVSAQKTWVEQINGGTRTFTTYSDGSQKMVVRTTCTLCGGSCKCRMCGGSGHDAMLPMICYNCSGTGRCPSCKGSGEFFRTFFFTKEQVQGNGGNYSQPDYNSGIQQNRSGGNKHKFSLNYYTSNYVRWETMARDMYRSILSSSSSPEYSTSADLSSMKQNFRESQRNMRSIRQNAYLDGYNLNRSEWEDNQLP